MTSFSPLCPSCTMLSQKPYQITEQQFEKFLQGIDIFHFKKKMAMFAFNTYTTHKLLALLMKYHCGINSCFFPLLIKFTRKPAIPARSCVFSISKTDMPWNKWVSNPTQFPFFFPSDEHTARWEQQRSSVVNKVVNQWSQWLGDLGKQQHWHVQATNSPHFFLKTLLFFLLIRLSHYQRPNIKCVTWFLLRLRWSLAKSINCELASQVFLNRLFPSS